MDVTMINPPTPKRNLIHISTLHPKRIFSMTQSIILNIVILYITIILILSLKEMLAKGHLFTAQLTAEHISRIVIDILSFLVLVELFRGFVEFFTEERIKLHTMIDPVLLFVLRELMIHLYKAEHLHWLTLGAFSFLILSLGIIRTLAVRVSPTPTRPHDLFQTLRKSRPPEPDSYWP